MDYAATTPLDPKVAEKMAACLTLDGLFANPASAHAPGRAARAAVEAARAEIAALVNAAAEEIVFTSGATEADNLAIKGLAHFRKDRGRHIVTSRIEHKAVLDACKRLEKEGFQVSWLKPDADGLIQPEAVQQALRPDTVLVTLMHANNEIGTLNDIAAIGKIVRAHGAAFHVDAAQSAGKVPIDLQQLDVDLMSFAAHKVYGPKGMGALYVRGEPRVNLEPLIHGGGHERGMRSGTVPVPLVVGFGKAAEICGEVMGEESKRMAALRDRLQEQILSKVDEAYVNGHPTLRLPHNLNISFAYVEGESVLMGLNREAALASGSACTSATLEPSYVISALGVDSELAHSSIRFGLHRFSTEEEVDFVAGKTIEVIHRLREMSPLYELAKEGVDLKSIHWKAE